MLTSWMFYLAVVNRQFILPENQEEKYVILKEELIYFLETMKDQLESPFHGDDLANLKSKISMLNFLFDVNGCLDCLKKEVMPVCINVR